MNVLISDICTQSVTNVRVTSRSATYSAHKSALVPGSCRLSAHLDSSLQTKKQHNDLAAVTANCSITTHVNDSWVVRVRTKGRSAVHITLRLRKDGATPSCHPYTYVMCCIATEGRKEQRSCFHRVPTVVGC